MTVIAMSRAEIDRMTILRDLAEDRISTMICINQLSSPGARVELDMVVAVPPNKKAT